MKLSFSFIDLFSGIGGIRIPFDELGGKCVFSCEINKFSRQTYFANFGEEPYEDITRIEPHEIPKHNLLLAGFPCQPFSQAGKKQGFQDDRGQMFFYIANILNHHRPDVVLLENVKGFRNHDKGRTLKTVVHTLEILGYQVAYQVLAAREFGLPQNRERIYIVAIYSSENKKNLFCFPNPLSIKTRLGDILEEKVDSKYTISDRLWLGHQRRKQEHKKKGNGFGYSLFNNDSPYVNTLSARYYKDGSEILVEQTNSNPRVLTPRECARLQGFPENFKIPVSDGQAWRQFGNSVPVNVIRAIAKQLHPYLIYSGQRKVYQWVDIGKEIESFMRDLYPENYTESLSDNYQQLSLSLK